ncbi:MAG: hypothetical protein ACKV0T_13045 [Planctomycetales bacterium]
MTCFLDGFTQTAGQMILDGGSVYAYGAVQIQGGSVLGSGPIYGGLVNGGTLSPGFSAGTIDVYDGYVQTAAGAYAVELGTQSDQLNIHGNVTLAGTLNLSLISGFHPTLNQTFIIVNNDYSDAITGTFAGLAEGALITTTSGWQFEISYQGGSGNDADVLTGSSGQDWFLFDRLRDRATDLKDEVFTADMEFILS